VLRAATKQLCEQGDRDGAWVAIEELEPMEAKVEIGV